VGRRAVHPVRQLQLRVPAQRDPRALLRARAAARRSRRVSLRAAQRSRAARRPLHAAGVRGGLHRVRLVRGGVSGIGGRRPGAQGDQPRGARAAARDRARQHRFLRAAARQRPRARGLRHRARHAAARAPVRVLGGVRGVRRDPVSEADLTAVWRPADDRQCDRVLVDLRRQPAHHPVGGRSRRARAGVVQLAVRGQRRVRARAAAGGRPARRARAAAPPRAA